jgi:hypothetical protein
MLFIPENTDQELIYLQFQVKVTRTSVVKVMNVAVGSQAHKRYQFMLTKYVSS